LVKRKYSLFAVPVHADTLNLLVDSGDVKSTCCKQLRVLHEVEPFRCIRCSKPFGTLRAIESMVAKLASLPSRAHPQQEWRMQGFDCDWPGTGCQAIR
jgi:hypothetical protein